MTTFPLKVGGGDGHHAHTLAGDVWPITERFPVVGPDSIGGSTEFTVLIDHCEFPGGPGLGDGGGGQVGGVET